MNKEYWWITVGLITAILLVSIVIISKAYADIKDWENIATEAVQSKYFWKDSYETLLNSESKPEYQFQSDDDLNWWILRQIFQNATSVDFIISSSSTNGTQGKMIIIWGGK